MLDKEFVVFFVFFCCCRIILIQLYGALTDKDSVLSWLKVDNIYLTPLNMFLSYVGKKEDNIYP